MPRKPSEAAAPARKSATTTRKKAAGAERVDTHAQLLDIAERLFAEQGVELVPLRQIVVESGQRNRSALHYHFGSRADLVKEVLTRRRVLVNERQHQLLSELEATGKFDTTAVLRTAMRPLFDVVRDEPWGRDYVLLLAQTTFSPQLASRPFLDQGSLSGLLQVRRLLQKTVKKVPPDVFDARLAWIAESSVFTFARWCRDEVSLWRNDDAFNAWIEFCVAGLLGPVTIAIPPVPRDPKTGMLAANGLRLFFASQPML